MSDIEKRNDELTRELERVEIWLSAHLFKDIDSRPSVIEIPTAQIVDMYMFISDTLGEQSSNKQSKTKVS